MRSIRTLLAVLGALAAADAFAATFCVGSSSALNTALSLSATNGSDNEIRIMPGTYTATSSTGFMFHDIQTQIHALKISGGWVTYNQIPCSRQQAGTPLDTILKGNGGRVMRIDGQNTDVHVDNVTFLNGDSEAGVGGLLIIVYTAGDILVERSAFIDNSGMGNSALFIACRERCVLRNSVFSGNTGRYEGSVAFAFAAGLWAGGTPDTRIYVTNNTIHGNVVAPSGVANHSGLRMLVNDGAKALLANNIVWNNDGDGASLIGSNGGEYYLHHNDFQSRTGISPVVDSGNLSIAPEFSGGFLDFYPAIGSALADAGIPPEQLRILVPPPFEDDWELGTTDFPGNARVRGEQVDIGAYEAQSRHIFADGFELEL